MLADVRFSLGAWPNGLAEWTDGDRFDWTERRLKAVQRWVNGRFWRYTDFARYNSAVKTDRAAAANGDLFEAAAA